MRSKLFVIKKRNQNQYWNSSPGHGTGWNPNHPKQAFTKSELAHQVWVLAANHWTDIEIIELDIPL